MSVKTGHLLSLINSTITMSGIQFMVFSIRLSTLLLHLFFTSCDTFGVHWDHADCLCAVVEQQLRIVAIVLEPFYQGYTAYAFSTQ